MDTTPKILIVDDEEGIRFSLSHMLARDGYDVTTAESGERALAEIVNRSFDVILLDLRLDDMPGLDVLAAVRRQGLDAAVIVLTAHGSMETAIEALRRGAHDYLLKPCPAPSLRESVRTALVERERQQRQQALLRQVEQSLAASLAEIRASVVNPSSPPASPDGERSPHRQVNSPTHAIVVDTVQHIVTVDGHKLDLSPTEFDLLAYLAQHVPRVIGAQELVQHVQGYDSDRFEAGDIIRHHIHRIRTKAEAAGCEDIIRTVRGVGYALNANPVFVSPIPPS